MIEFRITVSLDPAAEALLVRLAESLAARHGGTVASPATPAAAPTLPDAGEAQELLAEIAADRERKAAERGARAAADRAAVHAAEIGERARKAKPIAQKVASAQPAPSPQPPLPKYSPERNAVLTRDYPAGVLISKIHDAVNSLPGPKVSREAMVVHACSRLGLRRPATSAKLAPAPVAAPASSVVAAPAAPPPKPPAPVLSGIDARPLNHNGKIEATYSEIRDWAARQHIKYDGGNMDLVNKARSIMRRPPFVQVEA
jgi:hypothetical protein